MKKMFLDMLVLAITFVFINNSYAEVFKIDNIIGGTRGLKVKDKASGGFLWQSEIKTQKIAYNNQPFLYIEENGSGIYGKDKKWKSWESKAYYIFNGTQAIPYQTELIYKDKNEKVIEKITKIYYPDSKRVICQINRKTKEFTFKNDLIDRELLGTALMYYPFAEKRDFESHLLTNEPTLYKITLKYKGIENIVIGNDATECYKLEMILDLGALNIFGAFVPKTYFWYTTIPPHKFVKYEGLESGLGTPYVVMEASNL